MKTSTFVTAIKQLQYAEYGNELIGKIRLINSDTIELETVINNCGWDFMNRFIDQIYVLADEVQYQVNRGCNKTGINVELKAVNKKSKINGICKQQFKVVL